MPELNLQAVESTKEIINEKFPIMVNFFMEDVVKYIAEIKTGLAEKNAEKIKLPAHTIKSSARLLGAEKVSDTAKQIEKISIEIIHGNETDFSKILPLFEQLQKAYFDAEPELKALIAAK